MNALLVAMALVSATSATAQSIIGQSPVLEAGGTTCDAFVRMGPADRVRVLSGIEPLGGSLAGAEPAIAAQWAAQVASTCDGTPDRYVSDAARQALGGN